MTPERWQQLKQIFQSALERKPAERSAFLSEVCAGDPALRSEVESVTLFPRSRWRLHRSNGLVLFE